MNARHLARARQEFRKGTSEVLHDGLLQLEQD
jgi:hypothetical protein